MAIGDSLIGATRAYQDAQKTSIAEQTARVGQGLATTENAPVESFADLLKNGVTGTIEAQKNAEVVSMKAIANEADITDVIAAVNGAELALETVVSIRDKVVQAYQEIMRMPM